eukprot:TRINITY_DN7057_c0_g1_i1.p1 TRINITY_DN7057_c0_g1~~TRINITY_DN7057_c0_g1_i1.p1  ORF type:complete len:174 (-),score=26.12 TRINITY_DN7057_c0_g1_i1:97-618(-)
MFKMVKITKRLQSLMNRNLYVKTLLAKLDYRSSRLISLDVEDAERSFLNEENRTTNAEILELRAKHNWLENYLQSEVIQIPKEYEDILDEMNENINYEDTLQDMEGQINEGETKHGEIEQHQHQDLDLNKSEEGDETERLNQEKEEEISGQARREGEREEKMNNKSKRKRNRT